MSESTAAGRRQTLLLAGAGHAHVEVLRRQALEPSPELSIQLISPDAELAYSGMLPVTIAGLYQRREMHVNVGALAGAAGAHYLRTRVVGVQANAGRLVCENGLTLDYDLLSLDIGSAAIDLPRAPGAVPCVPVKPVDGLWAGIDAMDNAHAEQAETARVAVVGGGAGGVELILALAYRCRGWQQMPQLTLHARGDSLLADHSAAVRRRLIAALRDFHVCVTFGRAAEHVTADGLAFCDGTTARADVVFCATGARAPGWLADRAQRLCDLASQAMDRLRRYRRAAGQATDTPDP